MSSWQTRVRALAHLVSPSGKAFDAYWRGDDLDVEKRLGLFDYPGVDGTRSQDLGLKSDAYTLTLFFTGPDHDLDARAFRLALKERGPWTVTHPVDGVHQLQLVKAKFRIDPTDSGNVTQADSSWLEVPSESTSTSPAEMASSLEDAGDAAANAAADSINTAAQTSAAETAAIKAGATSGLAAIRAGVSSVTARYSEIKAQIQSTIQATVIDPVSLAAEIVQLVTSPGIVTGTVSAQVGALSGMASGIIATIQGLADSLESRNRVLVAESFASAVLIATSQAVTGTAPASRAEAVQTLGIIQDSMTSMIGAFDTAHAIFGGSIDTQYFTHSALCEAWLSIYGRMQRYLLSLLFGLKTETRIVLDRPRSTMEFTITEYAANAGNVDSYYAFVIASNRLHGREILRLPAGKEMVIYG